MLLAEFTATSCIGTGVAPTLASLDKQRSGLTRCDFETVRIDTHIGEVRESMHSACPLNCGYSTAATTAWPSLPCVKTASWMPWMPRRRAGAGAGSAYLLAPVPRASCRQNWLIRARDPVSGALPADFVYGTTHNSFSVADYVRRRCGLEGPAMPFPRRARRAPKCSAPRDA